jgi:TrmH family RNA methyltransferase
MGAHFRLPIVEQPWPEIQVNLEKASLRTFLAAADEGEVYYREDLRTPLALIVGGEAQGAGSIARTLADQILHIPMPGEGESLNAATAAAILLFEVARQRGQAQ